MPEVALFGPDHREGQDCRPPRRPTLDRAAENYRDGETVGFENVSTVIGADVAYTVEVERYRARVGGAAELAEVALRETTAFRREDGMATQVLQVPDGSIDE